MPGRSPQEDGGRDGSDAAISQGMLAATKDGDKRNGIFPRACGENEGLPKL